MTGIFNFNTTVKSHYQAPSSIVHVHSPDIDERWDTFLDSQQRTSKHVQCPIIYIQPHQLHSIDILPASPKEYNDNDNDNDNDDDNDDDKIQNLANKTIDYFAHPSESLLDNYDTTPDIQEISTDDDDDDNDNDNDDYDYAYDYEEVQVKSNDDDDDDGQSDLCCSEDGAKIETIVRPRSQKSISVEAYHRMMAQRYTARLLKIASVCQTSEINLPLVYQKQLDSLQTPLLPPPSQYSR
ncbi:hypothetical protein PHYBLDRAFT_170631 [Phycomyces blakesleeanus NRRL 1555(-)]|uniref:Uncharacterized protein n=1 Tax=Phycomyces blakesleeanus (strain ATCC 8743b / DSM 1359 / FGSC 10004 / NBRC 33097 / NRRL 1555) TaxID=763407 RepID=A0A167LWV7_PHYB8|nr:hypothetical protein PHYBLDRAFT_170631 [Phycomyces blakesleeanus NRRL 1555(-)]OAD71254.1 hypothetical protein PHYBLDRAFT_170631 [Phycomyces blakesleeanus NRRL 1555(-)]|eukprot:XP_018289294.1 hypothetical protein PHYBLDRAFT_170631 [Phycomyces blakesleeanus NRRL 1555(-)]